MNTASNEGPNEGPNERPNERPNEKRYQRSNERWSLTPFLREIKTATSVDVVFGGTTAGGESPVVIDSMIGTRSGALHNLHISTGFGLGGKALVLRRPVYVRDYFAARGITHHYDLAVGQEGLRAVFAVPVHAAGGTRGVVYGALRTPYVLGERVIDEAVSVVRRLEYESAVHAEVDRRIEALGDAALQTTRSAGARGTDQRLRDIYAELVFIRNQASEAPTRLLVEDLMHRVASSLHDPAAVPGGGTARPRLSRREIEVLAQVAIGYSNREIGQRLGLVASTVKSYLQSATRKLGVRNRMEAVAAARREGLVP